MWGWAVHSIQNTSNILTHAAISYKLGLATFINTLFPVPGEYLASEGGRLLLLIMDLIRNDVKNQKWRL